MSRPADPAALSRWRADTPGCERLIHLNNAGAALHAHAGARGRRRHLALESEIGGYEAAEARVDALRDAYAALGAAARRGAAEPGDAAELHRRLCPGLRRVRSRPAAT